MAVSETDEEAGINLRWIHRGEPLDTLLRSRPETAPLSPPAPDEVIARVEAVCICSSDIKAVRMGVDHPLLAESDGNEDTVLGHEVSLRVEQVGEAQRERFRPGQRLGLQPAMRINGRRRTIGFDVPGGFAQYLRLGPDALSGHVFDVPERLSAAEIALLEPYGCVERAYRPNVRRTLAGNGSALVYLGPGAERYDASRPVRWQRTIVVGQDKCILPSSLGIEDERRASLSEIADQRFDDIIALGELDEGALARLPVLLREGGLLLQARQTPARAVRVDPARIHYDGLAFVGTTDADILQALAPERQRFDVRPGGVALVHGAGGAMGRIHVHRLLQLENGPSTLIATSRNAKRLADLEADFRPMAAAKGKRLVIAETADAEKAVTAAAPSGLDDAVVVVPDPQAVAGAARWLAPGGMLAVFSGFAYGNPILLDLAGVAVSGKRFTGSTGCSVQDMKDVLSRVERGELDLLANLKAISGLKDLPKALEAVDRGAVSGKIVIYPHSPDLPFRLLADPWDGGQEQRLIGETEREQGR
ncbi:alcohol dehydrogenase catalytic domain-containing protein [Chelativorans sp. AA-79]|uniref:alcohol dehydrogenase catalytic domain-containing protein n=1 Tax=Chelativorans sp. AA-79 TaxID=3028735 RepID=UPI0023F80486|nr:alcohol dehydrogenase catalytic domain-containing protein [Chelativorans sp. AA-79]WEX08979.1 alcohol dehydrogenase catalytic domain-containing protein [Chelativorans sp. AA-79]